MILAGSVVQAAPLTELRSDLPGQITAQVTPAPSTARPGGISSSLRAHV